MSNAAIVDLGNKTLVFDSSMSPIAALELRQLAEEATQKPVSYLVNSHHHLDHCLGNQVFADTMIISSDVTKNLMQARFARLGKENFTEAILLLQQQKASTPWEKNLLVLELAELEMLQAFMPNFKPTLPSLTFSGSIELMGSKRSAKIQTFGVGHTASDAVLTVEEVLMAGDLVLNQHLAFMGHGNPQSWLERLHDLEQIQGMVHLIPGHGDVGKTSLVEGMRLQLLEMTALANAAQNIAVAQPPVHWLEWGLPASYRANLEFLSTIG
jgi:glyoxylase-like metal-dependent hydrolase (beta-lactamase superfamily II)